MTGLAERLPDTNTILRYLLEDDPQLSQKAGRFFEKVRTGEKRALILESVLVECVYVLNKFYKVPKDEVSKKLRGLLLYRGITNEDKKELIDALSIFASQNLDIVDCILCVKAKKANLSLFSFDERLLRLSRS